MSETCKMDCAAPAESAQPQVKFEKKRDIFRFKGPKQDMAINLEHVYKIVREDKKIMFQPVGAIPGDPEKPVGDFVEFETVEAATNAQEQILNIWASEVIPVKE